MAAQSLYGSLAYDGGTITIEPHQNISAGNVYGLHFLPGAPQQQLFRHHIPGTDGNIVVLGGRMGQELRVGVLSVAGDVATAIQAIMSELNDMSSSDVVVVMCGLTYERCHLRSCLPLAPARAIGNGLAGAPFEFVFDYDN
jgi:hypothetical protein